VAEGGSPQMDGTSRVTGDGHARFCERLGVQFPGPNRQSEGLRIRGAHRLDGYQVVGMWCLLVLLDKQLR